MRLWQSLQIVAVTTALVLGHSPEAQAGGAQSLRAAETQIKKKQYKPAIKTLSAFKGEGKEEALRHFHLARAHAGLKQWSDAEMANQRAVVFDPTLLEATYNNACYASLAGNAEKAVHYLTVLADALSKAADDKKRDRFAKLMKGDPDLKHVKKDKRYTEAFDRVAFGMPKADYEAQKIFKDVIKRSAAMAHDSKAQKLAQKHGLQVMNLTWEDTGRYKDSSVGPNISDMTIQVAWDDPQSERFEVTAMPVIRFPNFSDKTADIDTREFTLKVGNHKKGEPLTRISLYDFLKEPTLYMSKPGSWSGDKAKSLLAPERDSKVLVSAQACFLPIPKRGKAEFNPVLFNYQSVAKDPAVLTILVTREGTSTTIIDNQRDAFASGALWGQRLFHNLAGERTSLMGQRKSDFKAEQAAQQRKNPKVEPPDEPDEALNMVLLVQVPLKQKNPMKFGMDAEGDMPYESSAVPPPAAEKRAKSDVEDAVIGHGKVEGPFTEIDDLEIERDDRFPVRVTVQFYKATSNGVVSEKDLAEIAAQINKVYAKSDYVGSLVTQGETGRITEYAGAKVEPADWWVQFWKRYETSHKLSRAEAISRLKKLLGEDYEEKPVTELYLRDALKVKG